MDCDEIEIEATKTIGSTDIDKVLKKLKNKHTKESIILLDYIEKLEKENKNLKDINQKLLNKCQGRLSYGNEEIITELYTRLS